MESQENGLPQLESVIGYAFHDRSLLVTALTHTSFVKGDGAHTAHNERMEFLGDAVLELCVSEKIYEKHPEMHEGAMTQLRQKLVREEKLAQAARLPAVPDPDLPPRCGRLDHA